MKAKYLFAIGTMAVLATSCTDTYDTASDSNSVALQNRPSAGNVVLNVTVAEDEEDATTRAVWDDKSLSMVFSNEDKIGALLMDEFNETNIGNTSMSDYTFVDYNQTNYPFSTSDGGNTWSTPDNAALCEGNYFFTINYDGTYKQRGYIGFGVPSKQYNCDENGEYDLWASVAENQQYLAYAFIPATTDDVNQVDATFHPLFAAPKFKLMNLTGGDLQLFKLIIRTSDVKLMPDSVMLAPLSGGFKEVSEDYATGQLTNSEEIAALFSHATRVQNGFFAQSFESGISSDNTDGVYEYTIDFGDGYKVSHAESFRGCAVMPAGEYGNFDVYALVGLCNSENTIGIVSLTDAATPSWSGMDSQSGSMQTCLKPGVTQVYSASFDSQSIVNLGLKDFAITNSEDLLYLLKLKAKDGGTDLITITTLGDQVEMTEEIYDMLSDVTYGGINVAIDGAITIPASLPDDAINKLYYGQDGITTAITIKGTQVATKDLTNCTITVAEGASLDAKTNEVTIGNEENTETVITNNGTVTAKTINGNVVNNGELTVDTVSGSITNNYGATLDLDEFATSVTNSGTAYTQGECDYFTNNEGEGIWIVDGDMSVSSGPTNKGKVVVNADVTLNAAEGFYNEEKGLIENNGTINSVAKNEGTIDNNGTLSIVGSSSGEIYNSSILNITGNNTGWIYMETKESEVTFHQKDDFVGYIENTAHGNISGIKSQRVIYTASTQDFDTVISDMKTYGKYTDLYISGNYTLADGTAVSQSTTSSTVTQITITEDATVDIAYNATVQLGGEYISLTNYGTVSVNHGATLRWGNVTNYGTIRKNNNATITQIGNTSITNQEGGIETNFD